MSDQNWRLKGDGTINADDVAKIACALKSLAVYSSMVIDKDDNPDELQEVVEQGLDAIERIFET